MAIQSFRPTVGGGELQLERLLPHLVRRGVAVTVLTRGFPGQPRREVSGGAIVHRSALSGRSAASSIAFVGEGLTRLVPLAVRRHSILHAHGALSEGTIALAATAMGVPAVVTVFGTGWMGDFERLASKPAGRLRRRWLLQRAWFIALSAESKNELEGLGAPSEHIFEIPNGVDCDVYRPALPEERTRLREELGWAPGTTAVYVGRLEHIKGADTLIRALAQVDGLRLVIVGDGSARETLEQLAVDQGVADRVRFVGFSDRVQDHLRAADAFLLASRGEGMSNAILEGMASGLACVANATSGVPQLLGSGRGIIVPADNSDAWSDALRTIVDKPAAREELGRAASEFVRAGYSLDLSADRLVAAYRRVLVGNTGIDHDPVVP
jgi:glycosyltransferase involved in cell wall biosynthesis